jgi:hypothetical protein
VQLELDLLEPVRYVFVVDATDKDLPGVCMVGRYVLGSVGRIEWNRFGTVQERTVYLNSLKPV